MSGRTDDWGGAALTCPPRPDGISPYHALRPGNVKAGGSRELPSAMFCRSVSIRSTNRGTKRWVIPGSRLFS